jgi:hypothetical protein
MTIALETNALSEHIGVEVRGFDAGLVRGSRARSELRSLLGRHHLLLIRDRDLSAATRSRSWASSAKWSTKGQRAASRVRLERTRRTACDARQAIGLPLRQRVHPRAL